MAIPCFTYLAAMLRILHYLKSSLFHDLHFSSQSPLQLRAYIIDVNWVGDLSDRRCSTTGYCFLFGTTVVARSSMRQNIML
jgi:hypothetical protein